MVEAIEIIRLIDEWEALGASDTVLHLKTLLEHSGSFQCHSCGRSIEYADEIIELIQGGECGRCEHVRGNVYDILRDERGENEKNRIL